MMKRLLTVFLSLLFITTNAYAEWTAYSLDGKGNVRFYDKSTIKRNGDKVKVWMYINMSPDDKRWESLNTKSARVLEEIDCVNKTVKTLSTQGFIKPDLTGDEHNIPVVNAPTDYIVPETVTADLMKLVCKK